MKTDTAKSLFFTGLALSLLLYPLTACDRTQDSDTGSPKATVVLEKRLRNLEDREEIRRLLIDYGRFLDRRDFKAFSQLFAEEEGEWIGGMGKARGRQAIRKLMEEKIGGGEIEASNYHLFTNDSIDLNGDSATATTKWVFVIRNDSGLPQPLYLGHYEDRFKRENGQWKFLRRIAYSDIPEDPSTERLRQLP